MACRLFGIQAIIKTNADISSIWPVGRNSNEIRIKIQNIFIHENALQNVACETAAIFCGGDEFPSDQASLPSLEYIR